MSEQQKDQGKIEFWAVVDEWRPIAGYEGIYEVGKHGHVRRVAGGKGSVAGRVLKLQPRGEYFSVQLWKDGNYRNYLVHVLVAAAFLGPIPSGLEINHRDGYKSNNAVWNLEYVSHSDNNLHAYATGLNPQVGEQHPWTKLSDEQVLAIRREAEAGKMPCGRRRAGHGCRTLARKFGVAKATVQLILDGVNRKHVQEASR